MTWTRLSDTWGDDPVFDQLDYPTRWHYLMLIQLCSRSGRYDGVMSLAKARSCSEVPDPVDALGALILTGLVENVDGATVRVVRIEQHIPPPSVRDAAAATKVRTQRYRKHKNGDHSDCLPASCPTARGVGDAAGDASRQDSDGTGQAGTGQVLPPATNDDEPTAAATHSLVQASSDEEPPWLPDDPDYADAPHDSYR